MSHSIHRPFHRREFVRNSLLNAAALSIGAASPGGWIKSLAASLSRENRDQEKVLVVIQLTGGNDGLNTVIPYSDELYLRARPKLAIPRSDVLRLDSEVGLHPSLRGIASLIDKQKFTLLQGVGYPNPNRSHFESMDIWQSCQHKESRTAEGWLGRYFAQCNEVNEESDSHGLHLGDEPLPMALSARGVQTPSLASLDQLRWKGNLTKLSASIDSKAQAIDSDSNLLDFVSASTSAAHSASDRLEKALASPESTGDFPASSLAEKLKVISRLLLAGLRTRVYYVTLDGFDTHANQLAAHAGLLRQWSEALLAFHNRLDQAGLNERVLVLTFSEFGRRVSENASQGTDHGAAAPVFLSGPNLNKPILGSQPSLNELEDGDLKFHTDFRRVYATLIEDWLGASSKGILGKEYPKLPELVLRQK